MDGSKNSIVLALDDTSQRIVQTLTTLHSKLTAMIKYIQPSHQNTSHTDNNHSHLSIFLSLIHTTSHIHWTHQLVMVPHSSAILILLVMTSILSYLGTLTLKKQLPTNTGCALTP